MSHPNQVYSRDELLAEVWGWTIADQSTVTVHVRRPREEVEEEPTKPVRLLTATDGVSDGVGDTPHHN